MGTRLPLKCSKVSSIVSGDRSPTYLCEFALQTVKFREAAGTQDACVQVHNEGYVAKAKLKFQ